MIEVALSPALVVGTGLVGASVAMALTQAGVEVHLSDRARSHALVAASRGGGTVERDVAGNAFTVDASIVDPDTGLVDWLDAEGRAVTPDGGAPMRLPVAG